MKHTTSSERRRGFIRIGISLAALLVSMSFLQSCGQKTEAQKPVAENTAASPAVGSTPVEGGNGSTPAGTPPAEEKPNVETPKEPAKEPAKQPAKETKPVEEPKKPEAPSHVNKIVRIPSGQGIAVCLDTKVSTESEQAGQHFQASVKEPVVIDGVHAIPAGSTVTGEVTLAKRAPRVGGKARLALQFTNLTTPDGKSYPLYTDVLELEGESTTKGDVKKLVGTTVGGALIGGVLGGKRGAAKGAAGGAAVGGAWAVATRGNDIIIDPNTDLEVTLARDLEMLLRVPVTPLP